MQIKILLLAIGLWVSVAAGYLVGQSQDGVSSVDEEMHAIFSPGLYHKQLDVFEGSWNFTGQLWSTEENRYVPTKGTIEYNWVLGGRFLQGSIEGDIGAFTFSGLNYIGYDNYRQVYISNWMDDLVTSFMTSVGSFDRSTNSLTLRGLYDDVRQNRKDVPFFVVMSVAGGVLNFEMKLSDEDNNQPQALISFTATKAKPATP